MLSYQHGYHAGNASDLHKHSVLAVLLSLLTVKPRGISYLESHAGRGLYDLDAPEAHKTGEAARGVLRHPPPPGALADALAATRAAHGARAYPGSPLIARLMTREQDRLHLCELHPAEHAGLEAALSGPGIAIHRRDGHEGLIALCPPTPRRGLALIDPSYEVKEEYVTTADTALQVMAAWPEGVVAVWYPILPAGRHEALVARLLAEGPSGTLHSVAALVERPERGLTGSGIVVLNPPYGAAEAVAQALAGLGALLAVRGGNAISR
jgi:23S rRNA (adenine2030-N6)-methyltransferase